MMIPALFVALLATSPGTLAQKNCVAHADCESAAPFCFESECSRCEDEALYCADGVDGTVGPCDAEVYPLEEEGAYCPGVACDSVSTRLKVESVTSTMIERNGCGDVSSAAAASATTMWFAGRRTGGGCGDDEINLVEVSFFDEVALGAAESGVAKSVELAEADGSLPDALATTHDGSVVVWKRGDKIGVLETASGASTLLEAGVDVEDVAVLKAAAAASSQAIVAAVVDRDGDVSVRFYTATAPSSSWALAASTPLPLLDRGVFVLSDASSGAFFVVGNYDDDAGSRGVAKVRLDGGVEWTIAVRTDEGTPRPLLRTTSTGSSSELLLVSKSFYARLSTNTGETVALIDYPGSAARWLPTSTGAQAAYDPTTDSIYTVDASLEVYGCDSSSSENSSHDRRALRVYRHAVETGQVVETTLVYYSDIEAADPRTDLSLVPGECDGAFECATTSGVTCEAYPHFNCDAPDEGHGACCAADGSACCMNDLADYYSNWAKYPSSGSPDARGLFFDSSGTLFVWGTFSGYVDDEDNYEALWVAALRDVAHLGGGDGAASGPTACADSAAWSKSSAPSKDCDWVAIFPEARCLVKADDATYAYEHCLESCGACDASCDDDASWHKNGEPSKDCTWVKRVYNRCSVLGADANHAFRACRRTCQTCNIQLCPHNSL